MNDFLEGCISDIGVAKDYAAFQATFCVRCRNRDCIHAKWAGDKFAARVATQPERLFKPNQADTRNPKYAQLSDFVDNLREALRLEMADRKKDWEVPEIPILDGRDAVAPPRTTGAVDNAVRALARAKNKDLILPDPWEADKKTFVDETAKLMPADEPDPVPGVSDPAPELPAEPPRRGKALGNVPAKDGVILGGGPARKPSPGPETDAWEPRKKVATVEPGARIRLGGEPKKGEQ